MWELIVCMSILFVSFFFVSGLASVLDSIFGGS